MALSTWHSMAIQTTAIIRQHTPLPLMVVGFRAYIVGHAPDLPFPHCNNNRRAS